jgi:nickel-dependent lactate racemase
MGRYLPFLLDQLNAAGVPDERISACIALGVHRPLTEDEMRSLLGPAGARIRVENHDPLKGLVALGSTSRGTPILVNEKVCTADLVLSLGSISFHFHAGFGGGPKGIIPGLAGAETIRTNHLLALSGPGDTWHPGVGPGRLEGNPVHEDLLEALSRIPTPIFLVNFVPDPAGRPLAVEGGAVKEAHRAACLAYARHFVRPVPEPYDAVVVCPGGHPRDVNLIQAHKAAAHAAGALRPGGSLILVAECPEGLGHPDLAFWFDRPLETLAALSRETGRKYVQTAYSFREKAHRFSFHLLTAPLSGPMEEAGLHAVQTPEDIAALLKTEHGDAPRGLALTGTAVLYTPLGEAMEKEGKD